MKIFVPFIICNLPSISYLFGSLYPLYRIKYNTRIQKSQAEIKRYHRLFVLQEKKPVFRIKTGRIFSFQGATFVPVGIIKGFWRYLSGKRTDYREYLIPSNKLLVWHLPVSYLWQPKWRPVRRQ